MYLQCHLGVDLTLKVGVGGVLDVHEVSDSNSKNYDTKKL